jgi:2-polyprenyl-3-methyl-5-hydroxy-6-metoxy-1,4-benzoquinol methylase
MDDFFKFYHTFTRRPNLDPKTLKTIFKFYNRNFLKFLPSDKEAYILDLGCGEGFLLLWLKYLGYKNIFGIDISEENINIANSMGLNCVLFNVVNLKNFEPNKKFDLICAIDLLEHITKDRVISFLSSVYEKLNEKGTLIIQTPNMGSFLGLHMRYSDFTHEFGVTEKSVVDLLLSAGFRVENIEVLPSWNATTLLGYIREFYLKILHKLIFLAEDKSRPKIPTKNLLVIARK